MSRFDSISITTGLMLSLWLWGSAAYADPSPPSTPRATASPRTRVLVAIVGEDADAVRQGLVAPLDGQLRAMHLSLVEQRPRGAVSNWAMSVTRSPDALLAVVLEVKPDGEWSLVLVDTARARAIARELPGGVERDAASIEAVTSIVISAANALKEGLEVASAPVSAVVGPPQIPAVRPSPAGPLSSPAPPGETGRHFVVHGRVGAALASFGSHTPVTTGAMLALGLGYRRWLEARVFGTLFLPVEVQSPFGDFRLNRALAGAVCGPVFSTGGFSISPEVGLTLERLRRSSTLPAPGLFAKDAAPVHRWGGMLDLRLRHVLVEPVSIELVGGAAYTGQAVTFSVRNGDPYPFLEIGPAWAFAQVGVDIATK